jgi:hypothetical protein
METLSNAALQVHKRLTEDFPYFAKHCLRILDKAGNLVPFELNRAQRYINERAEDQLRRTGRVRLIIPKARQGGVSTYVAGRFYHKNNRLNNRLTFILSHQAKTTDKLFDMAERYHFNCPDTLKPKAIVDNSRQLVLENGSEYAVGTAGSGDVGRGFTAHQLHLSEAAFYEKTDEIDTGLLQAVSDEPGTEVFVESTGNGVGNWFYRTCMDALKGIGDFECVFIPWFWMEEYRRPVPEDFVITPEEQEYKELYDLDDEQIYWRRKKIENLKSEWKFKQEYPANIDECFQTSGDPLINAEKLMQARHNKIPSNPDSPLIMGVDPKGSGKDDAGIVFRKGDVIPGYKLYKGEMDPMRFAGICMHLIDTMGVDMMFIDNGYGYQIASRMWEMGYKDKVRTVDFSESPIEDDKYLNKRAEMGMNYKYWVEEGNKSVPDTDEFYTDTMCIPRELETSNNKFKLESKEKIKEVYGRSPTLFDAAILTFAYPVRKQNGDSRIRFKKVDEAHKAKGPLKTLNRTRYKNQDKGKKEVSVWGY